MVLLVVLGGFVGGFGSFWVVLGCFGWFWVVPCFSNYAFGTIVSPSTNYVGTHRRERVNRVCCLLQNLLKPWERTSTL